MGTWTEEMKRAAADRLSKRMAALTPEERSERGRRGAATREANREAKASGVYVEKRSKPGRPRKSEQAVNLDVLAQQMGFVSARAALIDAAVKNVGFTSVEEAALWAVKNKQVPTVGRANQMSGGGLINIPIWDDGGEA